MAPILVLHIETVPDVAGIRRARELGQVANDATVVERLREAGAVLVAKLSMGALAQWRHVCAGDLRQRGCHYRVD